MGAAAILVMSLTRIIISHLGDFFFYLQEYLAFLLDHGLVGEDEVALGGGPPSATEHPFPQLPSLSESNAAVAVATASGSWVLLMLVGGGLPLAQAWQVLAPDTWAAVPTNTRWCRECTTEEERVRKYYMVGFKKKVQGDAIDSRS